MIDSGINLRHPGVREPLGGSGIPVIDGGAYGRSGRTEQTGIGDRIGHGTWVAASILAIAPNCELVSLRVFDDSVVCSVEALLSALEASRDFEPDLVNLSVGTTAIDRIEELRRTVELLRASETRLVAPATVSGLASYPGSLEGVDAVVPDPNQPRTAPECREVSGRPVWFASPRGPSLDRQPPPLCEGASLATAHVTGFLAATTTGRPR